MFAKIPFSGDASDDRALLELQHANPLCRLEYSSDGTILVSPLSGTATAKKEAMAYRELLRFAERVGGDAHIASAGFRLPDGSVLGPDAAWISPERLSALASSEKEDAFWHVCPDVVIEVFSENDTWSELVRKIRRFVANGATYAVAVDPRGRHVYEIGTPPLGLTLDFEAIFDA